MCVCVCVFGCLCAFVCALSGLVGLVAVSLVLMRQRSGVPFSFTLSDGQGVHLSLPTSCLGNLLVVIGHKGDWIRIVFFCTTGRILKF